MPVKLGGAGGELNPQERLAFQEPAPRTVAAHELQKGAFGRLHCLGSRIDSELARSFVHKRQLAACAGFDRLDDPPVRELVGLVPVDIE